MYHYHGHPHFYIRSRLDGKVLTVDGHKADDHVIVHHRQHPADPKQLWRFEMLGEHFHIVSALNPDLVLDVKHNNHHPGAELIIYHRNHPPTPNQIFEWHGGHCIRSHLGHNLVLDIKNASHSDHAKVIIYENHGGVNQHWEVDRAEYFE